MSERDAKVSISIDVRAEAKDAEKLLGVFERIEATRKRIREGAPSADHSYRPSRERSARPSEMDRSRHDPIGSGTYSNRPSEGQGFGRSDFKSALDSVTDAAKKAAAALNSVARSVTPTSGSQSGKPSPGNGFWGNLKSLLHFNHGGTVPHVPGIHGDNVPIMAMAGERVIPVDVARRNKHLIDAIMSGSGQHYAEGGVISGAMSAVGRGVMWAGGKAKDYVSGKYAALEKRYGRATAIAIMSAGALGLPSPIPGSSFLTAAPVLAGAEAYRYLRGEHKADGGYVGHGSQLIYCTPGERIIPSGVAEKHRSIFDNMTSGKHFALGGAVGGGSVGISNLGQYTVSDVRIINFHDLKPHLIDNIKAGAPSAMGTQTTPETPGSHGFASRLAGGFGNFSQVAGAAGANNAAGIANSFGGVATAFAAGGPVGIAVAGTVASMEVFKVGLDKTTTAINIMSDGTRTRAQRDRDLGEEFIPLYKRLNDFGDAINGTTARINASNQQRDLTTQRQNAQFSRDQGVAGLVHQRNSANAAAFGMRSHSIARANSYDHATGLGQLQAREEDARLRADDDLVNAQRRLSGADEAVRLQRHTMLSVEGTSAGSVRSAELATERSRRTEAAENRVTSASGASGVGGWNTGSGPTPEWSSRPVARGFREVSNIAHGWGALGESVYGGTYFRNRIHRDANDPVRRIRAERTDADNTALTASNQAQHDLSRLEAERSETSRVTLERSRAITEVEKARVGILQSQLEIMRARSSRMEEDANRLGSMNRGERRQALRSFQRIGRHIAGGGDIDRFSAHAVSMAARFDPRQIREWQEVSGNRFARENVGHMGAIGQRDWANNASIGDSRREERTLEQQIRLSSDDIAVRGTERIAQIISSFFERYENGLDRKLAIVRGEMEARMRAWNNNR